jgi:phosphoglycerate dehydrogenase-like enzyme
MATRRITTVVPDDYPIAYGGLEHPQLRRLLDYGEVICHSTRYADRQEFFERLKDADAAINVRAYSTFDKECFDACPKLKMVSILGTGTDNVDLVEAKKRGITVTNTPAINHVAVAELCMGLLFAAVRSIPLSERRLRAGTWQHPTPGFEIQGKTLGLLGLGVIGSHMAKLGKGVGMRVIAWSWRHDPQRAAELGVELVDRDEVFRQADVVSLHLRNTPEVRGSVGRREFEMMKSHAVLLNTARAGILNQDDLVEALKTGQIGAAGLDVHTVEPLPLDQNPYVELDNVVITPHLGGSTVESNARSRKMPVDNIIAWHEGKPEHVVNP